MAGSGDGGGRRDKTNHYRRAVLLHPLRQRILRLMAGGRDSGAIEIAAELNEALGRVAYHLGVLVRRDVLKVVPRRRPAPPLYRRSSRAHWVPKMLGEDEE